MAENLTSGDLCRMFRVLPWQIEQVCQRGLLKEPKRLGRWRIWRSSDLPAVEEALIAAGYVKEKAEVANA
jgi:hypothetical protein